MIHELGHKDGNAQMCAIMSLPEDVYGDLKIVAGILGCDRTDVAIELVLHRFHSELHSSGWKILRELVELMPADSKHKAKAQCEGFLSGRLFAGERDQE